MAWGKIDDNFAFHPKVVVAGNEAIGFWVRALSYSCQQLTDGFIPTMMVTALGDYGLAERLVDVGLWDEVDGGFQFHQWNEYQPSGAETRARRAEISRMRSEIGKKGADSKWNGKPDGKPDGKPMANGKQTGWQNDGPVPEPVPEPNTTSKEVVLSTKTDELFERFWSVWPRRQAKGSARAAWAKAVKKASPEVIIQAATLYGNSPYKPEQQFIPMPATWLNGERWLDDAPTAPQVVTKAQKNLSTVEYFEHVDRLAVEA